MHHRLALTPDAESICLSTARVTVPTPRCSPEGLTPGQRRTIVYCLSLGDSVATTAAHARVSEETVAAFVAHSR